MKLKAFTERAPAQNFLLSFLVKSVVRHPHTDEEILFLLPYIHHK